MEPETGRIVALASVPNFSPGRFLEKDNKKYIRRLLSNSNAPLINRVIAGQYPLGSVFKVISSIAALEKKKITPRKRFFCSGKMFIGNREFSCLGVHGSQDLIGAIAHSCNIYFYHLSLLLGPDILSEYASKLGLGKITGIDLPYEASGAVPSPLAYRMKFKSWYDGDTANLGIGQGDLLVTPIQTVRFMAALINGGKLVRPYVVKAIDERDLRHGLGTDLHLETSTIGILKEALRQAVASEGGTANIMRFKNLQLAGKTGTAQVYNKLSHGWFVGFAPLSKPKVVFSVFLENCGSSVYALRVAREIFSRMLEEELI